MNTIKILSIAVVVLGIASNGFAFSAKYTTPEWDMSAGPVTNYAKGQVSSQEYTPRLIQSYDKQHKPWFENTLDARNIRN